MANNCTPNIQAKLNDLYSLKRYQAPAGTVDLALSPANGAQVQARMIQENGKDSQYSITYAASQCDEPVACGSFDCTGAGTDSGTLTSCLTFNSFDCYSMPTWKNIGIASLRDLGSMEVMEVFAANLWDQMQKIKAKINVASLTSVCAGSQQSTNTLKLINALGAPVFNVDVDIMADYADAGFGGVTPMLLGNRIVAKFAKGVEAGGLNGDGVNLNMIDRFPAFYDKDMVDANCAPDTAGNQVLIAALPGVVNLLSWSKNAGMFASRQSPSRWDNVDPSSLIREGETFLHTVIEDPSGLLFDLDIVYEPKCQKWQYAIRSYYKTLILPTQGCIDEGFTGLIKYDVCPETAVSCD